MTKKSFESILKKMPDFLKSIKPIEASIISILESNVRAIYVFYERNKPVYVGRTNNLKRRIKEHSRPGGKHNDANLAFKIAKIDSKMVGTRNVLSKMKKFNNHFTKAKRRVSKMKVYYVQIHDADEQYLFEFYAAKKLKTKYNQFDNH